MAACQLLYEITAFFMENPSVKSKIDCHLSPRREEQSSNAASIKQTVGFKRRRKTIRVSIINFRIQHVNLESSWLESNITWLTY